MIMRFNSFYCAIIQIAHIFLYRVLQGFDHKNMEGPIHLSLHKTFISFRMLWKRSRTQSLADVQLRNDGTIALDVLLGQVVEQAAALTDHLVHAKP